MNDSWDYYAFGNGFLINDVLLGVMGIFGEDSYTGLLVIVALAAFIVIVPMKALANKIHEVVAYFAIIALVMGLLFDSTIDITVKDKLKPGSVYVVQDVPMLVGIPLVATNEIGWQISEWYETHMAAALPYGFQLTGGGGFAIGSTMLQDMQSFRITDSALSYRLGNFLRDCVVPKFYLDPSAFSAIHDSTDVWTQMASNDGLRTTKENHNTVVTCAQAYSNLGDDYFDNGDVFDDLIKAGKVTSQAGSNSILSGGLGGLVGNSNVLTGVVSTLGGGALTGNSFLQGNILAPELRQAARDVAVMTGSNEFIASVNLQQARKGQTTGWLTAAILFRDMAGYLFAGLNLFVIGLMPIIILGLFIPKFGTKVVIMYLKVLVWLMLWWPGLTLVNHISQGYMLNALMETGGWWNGDNAPWSMSNAPIISDYAANASMAAGFLATLVPMIMWSIISGSGQAFAGVLQGASGTAEARDAASKISKGSLDAGIVNYDNINANKTNTASEVVEGDKGKIIENGLGTSAIKNSYNGATASIAGKDVTPTFTTQTTATESSSFERSQRAEDSWDTTTKNSQTVLSSSADSALEGISAGFSGSKGDRYQVTDSEIEATAQKVNAAAIVSSKATEGEAYESALAGKLRVGLGLGGGDLVNMEKAIGGDSDALSALKSAGGKAGVAGAILSAIQLGGEVSGTLKGSSKDTLDNSEQNSTGVDTSRTTSGQSGSQSSNTYDELSQFAKQYSTNKNLNSEERAAVEEIYAAAKKSSEVISGSESLTTGKTVTRTETSIDPELNSRTEFNNEKKGKEAKKFQSDTEEEKEKERDEVEWKTYGTAADVYGGQDETRAAVKQGQDAVSERSNEFVGIASEVAEESRLGAANRSGGSDNVGTINQMNADRLGVAGGDESMQDIRLSNGGVLKPEGAANTGAEGNPEASVVYGMYGKDGEKIDSVVIKESENGNKYVYGVGDTQDWKENRDVLRESQETYGGGSSMLGAQAKDAFALVVNAIGGDIERYRDVGEIGTLRSDTTNAITEDYGQITNKGYLVKDNVQLDESFDNNDREPARNHSAIKFN
jgi:conjugal transfer mating pair stabilization protein TraG